MKKIKIKPLITTILLIVFQTTCYFTSKLFEGTPHLIGNAIDDKIPFNIWFIIPYCLWYLLIFIVPYYLYIKDKDRFVKYIYSYIACTIIANIIFIIYPTTVSRPDVVVTGPISFITHFIFSADTPIMNCFPSLHCAMSLLFILFIIPTKNINNYIKLSIIFLSILIMASTLFIKQHVFIDAISGNILAIISYYIIIPIYKKNYKFQKLLKN